MNKVIIVDLDGTLADCSHRRHLVENTATVKNWDKFYRLMIDDKVNGWCKELIRWFDPLFVSGRPGEYRQLTIEWFKKNNIYCENAQLFMRRDGDYRDDAIVKEEIYEKCIKPYYNVLFVVDDRKKAVDMWRKNGLVCLHCAEGDF
jgi:hypothetical protein